MKKIISIFLCIAIVLSLAACGGKEATDNTDANGGTTDRTGNSQTTDTNDTTSNNTESGGNGKTDGSSGNPNASNTNNTTNNDNPSTSTVVTTDEAYKNFKAIFPDKTFINVRGKSTDPKTHMVKMEGSDMYWRYVTVKANKKGNTVNIFHTSDYHIVSTNEEDLKNPVTASVFEKHSMSKNGMGKTQFNEMLKFTSFFDFTVSTGDNVDYMHLGALEFFKQTIFKLENAFFCLGNHDADRTNGGSVADTSTRESRYEVLAKYWPHDLDYSSKVIKDTVMIIQLDNSPSKYYGEQATKLAADIEKARKGNLTVLIFQHKPLGVNDVKQSNVYPIDGGSPENFQKAHIGGSKYTADAVTQKVYDLITQNADVVRGVFCGHVHDDFYTEIHGSYTKNNQKVDAIIPQYVVDALHQENGTALAITVK